MTTNDNGDSDHVDLDRLIGELETEAARRRAEPGYPHDTDARLHFELARRAPHPAGADAVDGVIARVEEAASQDIESQLVSEPGAPGWRRHAREAMGQRLLRSDRRVSALGLAAAGALRAVARRLEQLEERVRDLEPRRDDTTLTPSPSDTSDALEQWRGRLAETLPRGERVLYAQSRAEEVVAALRAEGIDAYGVTGRASPPRRGPDVRSGDVLGHLRGVPDAALGAVVLAGLPEEMSAQGVAPLMTELARVTGSVVLVSEAPWWWRLRLGAVRADLAPGRPLDPDTWLHAFHGVTMVGTVEYDPAGHSYRLVARRRE